MPRKNNTCKAELVPFHAFAFFLLISFGLAWGILGLYIFVPERTGSLFGQLSGNHPLFFLAVYAPAISAFILVARSGGLAGLRQFLGRALLWRCSAWWYAFLLIGVPLIFICGSAIRGNLFAEPFPFSSFPALLLGLILAAVKGPVEEFGWRGLALPLLQRKLAPIWAGLVLGAIWGLWHMPAFLLSGTQQSQWSFAPFFVGCLAISVIATALFNRSGGSILLSAFFHFSLMNPIFPDAQPYDTYLLFIAASLIFWYNRKDMLRKEGSVTEVIPPRKNERDGSQIMSCTIDSH
ncbi:MAG: CPBP family intramembrane glutamic endopeptidase [Desulfopila sp.]|jgi:membrane protease YdiL (CAAX protease family)|nr:CPBP family intramembrane glutamic endopeptidase [Desulfopila sp.]